MREDEAYRQEQRDAQELWRENHREYPEEYRRRGRKRPATTGGQAVEGGGRCEVDGGAERSLDEARHVPDSLVSGRYVLQPAHLDGGGGIEVILTVVKGGSQGAKMYSFLRRESVLGAARQG